MKIIYQKLMRTGHWKDIEEREYCQLDENFRRAVYKVSAKPDGYFKDHMFSCYMKASRDEKSGYLPFIIIGDEVP